MKDYTTREQRLGVGFEVEKGDTEHMYTFDWKLFLAAIGCVALAWTFVSLYFLTFSH